MSTYLNDVLGGTPGQCVTENPETTLGELEREYKKTLRKRKRGKISKKKFQKKMKKIEKKFDRLESAVVHQKKCSSKYTWWQQTLVDSAPKALELAAVALSQKDAKRKI